MLPGVDNPGKHSLQLFYSNIMSPQFEYYYITLVSPGRLYPCRWHHTRYHCEVIVGATYQGVVELSEVNSKARIKPAPSSECPLSEDATSLPRPQIHAIIIITHKLA
jgi:hypothetical protein